MINRFVPERTSKESSPSDAQPIQPVIRMFMPTLPDLVRLSVVAAIIGGGLLGWRLANSASRTPSSLKKLASFPVYYPRKLPQGLKFDPNSLAKQNGVVVFSLKTGDNNIKVTEQPRPSNAPDLTDLTKPQSVQIPDGAPSGVGGGPVTIPPSFQKVDCQVGQCIVGTGAGNQALAIVLTSTALINFSGPSYSSDDITKMIRLLAN
jgi:hypothetical protein